MKKSLGLLVCIGMLLLNVGCNRKAQDIKYWYFESNCETIEATGCVYKIEEQKVIFETGWMTLTNYNGAYQMSVVLKDSDGKTLNIDIKPGGVVSTSEIAKGVEYSLEVYTNAPQGEKIGLFVFDGQEAPIDIIESQN